MGFYGSLQRQSNSVVSFNNISKLSWLLCLCVKYVYLLILIKKKKNLLSVKPYIYMGMETQSYWTSNYHNYCNWFKEPYYGLSDT